MVQARLKKKRSLKFTAEEKAYSKELISVNTLMMKALAKVPNLSYQNSKLAPSYKNSKLAFNLQASQGTTLGTTTSPRIVKII